MNASDRFHEALLRYSREADPVQREAIDKALWRDFGATRAVLVVDMSGFSSISHRHGLVHFLSMVERMRRTAEPLIHGFDGVILKFEADNAYAMFPEVDSALQAAVALDRVFEVANADTPDELDIRIGCGIDFGPVLVVEGHDFYGDAVNLASKLGEDLAEPGEILLSAAARQAVPSLEAFEVQPLQASLSGLRIEAWRLRRRQDEHR